MIETKTTLILGAGASMPYGFPSGESLFKMIIDSLTSRLENNIIAVNGNQTMPHEVNSDYQFYRSQGYSIEDINNFKKALEWSGMISIDSFLEHRPEFIPLGKLAIANILLKFEKKNDLISAKEHWYKYLWNKLTCPIANFKANRLSIITFNYDRSLEYYLFNCIQHTYGKGEDFTIELLKSTIDIIHLHGKLGSFIRGDGCAFVPYDNHDDNLEKDIVNASREIKIIHEDLEYSDEFTKADRIINESEQVYILGFGYHPINLRRLQLEFKSCPKIVGSAFGLTDHEIKTLSRRLNGKVKLEANGENLSFLRNFAYLT